MNRTNDTNCELCGHKAHYGNRCRELPNPLPPPGSRRVVCDCPGPKGSSMEESRHNCAVSCGGIKSKPTEATFENTSDEQLIAFVRSRPPQHNVFAREVAEELANRLERLRTEYDEVRFNRKHTKDSPQHGDDITLCGRDCEGRA